MKRLEIVLIAVITALIVGCAAQVQEIGSTAPATTTMRPGDVIFGSITADPTVTSGSDYASSMDDLKSALSDRLPQVLPGRQLVFSTPAAGTNSGMKMEITVLDLDDLSGAGRFFTGIAAGHARLEVHVVLTDLRTGSKVGDAEFGTKSSNWEGIFGATTSRQIDAVADHVVDMIVKSAASVPAKPD